MRIYIERVSARFKLLYNGRPFNYFKETEDDVGQNRINYVEAKKKALDDLEQNMKLE